MQERESLDQCNLSHCQNNVCSFVNIISEIKAK